MNNAEEFGGAAMDGLNEPVISKESSSPGATAEVPAAFCANCGRPLSTATMRVVGAAAYCEPCLAARLGTPIEPPVTVPWAAAMNSSEPNPGLAALLGLIPGVGAMYNGQYAKGIVHLIVFVVFVQLAHWVDVFGVFVAGWIFYMAIEAHHTARARRDGTPLPNPFGLNDVGERFGFGRSWPAGPGPGAVVTDAANTVAYEFRGAGSAYRPASTAAAGPMGPAPSFMVGPAPGPASSAPGWGAPFDTGAASSFAAAPGNPPAYASSQSAWTAVPVGMAGGMAAGINPRATAPLVPEPGVRSRFPAGAVLLIGLGILFTLHTSGLLHGFTAGTVIGLGLIGLGAWLFARRLLAVLPITDPAEADTSLRILQAIRDSGPVTLLGVLNLLDGLHVVPWSRSWPFAIIFAGLLLLAHRAIANTLATSAAAARLRAYEESSAAWSQQGPASGTPVSSPAEGGL